MTISQIMTKEVITVHPETPLYEAAEIITSHHFTGVPVVDEENKLVGILTEYDLINGESAIHLPTLHKVLSSLKVFRKDKSEFKDDIKSISKLTVKDIMNQDPLTLPQTTSFEEALKTFQEHHRVNPIPVLDEDNRVVGVLSRYDILKGVSR